MTHRDLLLYSLTTGFLVLLCVLIYSRKLQRRLPFFTTYSTLSLASILGMAVFYHHFGFRSATSYNAYWLTTGVIVVSRSFAIGELCRYELQAYQGIWALTWRVLAILVVFFSAMPPWTPGARMVELRSTD